MALSERSRSNLYQALTTLADEEAVGEMLSYFPARDTEEPATHHDLELLRSEMQEFRTEMRSEMQEFRTEMRSEMDAFRAEIRSEMRAELGSLRGELSEKIESSARQLMAWTVAAMLGGLAIAFGIGQATG